MTSISSPFVGHIGVHTLLSCEYTYIDVVARPRGYHDLPSLLSPSFVLAAQIHPQSERLLYRRPSQLHVRVLPVVLVDSEISIRLPVSDLDLSK